MLYKRPKTRYIILICGVFVICYLFLEKTKSTEEMLIRTLASIQTVYNQTVSSRKSLAEQLKCNNNPLEMQRIQHGFYWLIQNYVRGSISRNIGCADSITYATNGDYTFFWTLPTVVKRWLGPVSFAVYAPGYDFDDSMESIQYVRNCLPESELIKQFVTFHIYFPDNHMPQYIPRSENEALQWSYDCDNPPYKKGNNKTLYRKAKKMTYPINVGRNIARKAVNTYFIFTCDLELYPSPGFVDKFLQMITRNISLVIDAHGVKRNPRVFVLNIYELQANAAIPDNKEQLVEMVRKKKALGFHLHRCRNCHRMPYTEKWLNLPPANEMRVIATAKRQNKSTVWEPFYISDNKEPVFDERVHWEGQSNKRIQGFAMCLLDYDYKILNDGFLVHSPGIKKLFAKDKRYMYMTTMNRFISRKIVPEYNKLYGTNAKCKV